MELDWLGGHIDTNLLDFYISPTSGMVQIGVSVNKDFLPMLVFKKSKSIVEFVDFLITILEIKKIQMSNSEVPKVFRESFDSDNDISGIS